ncbi:hypothetical protein AB0M80_31010 [Amycolatopsis sp. NPDC051045]|uniref:hypothetical protein n=1 Tax=Amycolatopsis sp. NPDC051045 TaxID=3156922 RepID=UPI00343FB1EE
MNAGRILGRALVVIGGAAAACALAWLTATASADTVTQVADGPIEPGSPAVVTAIGHPEPPVLSPVTDSVPVVRRAHDAATPALAPVRDLSGAAAHPARLAEVLETNVTSAVPATVVAVGRIAVAATDLAGLSTPAEGLHDHGEKPPVALGTAGSDDALPAPADSDPRKRSAGRFPATIPVRAAATAVAGQLHADDRPEHGAAGPAGRSWLPSCVVPASAGLTAGHDHSGGDVAQSRPVEHPQPSHRRNGVLGRAVTAAEIQPGVTPD